MLKLQPQYSVFDQFAYDDDITKMRKKYVDPGFSERFNMAFLNYEAGEWLVAQSFLLITLNYFSGPPDGPTVALLRFLELTDFQAPKDWPGYRFI